MIVLYILLGIIAVIVIALHFSVRAYIKAGKDGVDIKVKYMFWNIYPRPEKPPKKPKKKKRKREKPPEENQEETSETALNTEISQPEEISIEELMKLEVNDVTPDENPEGEETDENKEETAEETEEAEETTEEKSAEENPQEDFPEEADDEVVENDEEKEKSTKEKVSSKIDNLKGKFNKIKPYIPMGWKYFKKMLKTIRIHHLDFEITVGKDDAYEAAMLYGKVQGAVSGVLALVSGMFTVKIDRADVKCVFDKKTFDGKVSAEIKIRPSAVIAIAVCVGVNFLKLWLPGFIKSRKKAKAEKKKAEVKDNKAEEKAA